MLKVIANVVAVVAVVGGVVSSFVALINMVRVTFHIKEGVTIYGRKTNVMFRPHDLTERGLIVRRRFYYSLIGFVACTAITVACSFVLK